MKATIPSLIVPPPLLPHLKSAIQLPSMDPSTRCWQRSGNKLGTKINLCMMGRTASPIYTTNQPIRIYIQEMWTGHFRRFIPNIIRESIFKGGFSFLIPLSPGVVGFVPFFPTS